MITQTAFEARPYAGEADLPGICDLINTCNTVDQMADEPYASVDGTRLWLVEDPDRDVTQDVRLWVDDAGRVVALASVSIAPQTPEDEEKVVDGRLYLRVHPETRDRGLESAAVEWASDRVRAVAAERGQPAHLRCGMHLTTPEYIAYRQGMLEGLGFRAVRYFFKMARPLDQPIPEPQFPAGYTLRPLAGPAEYEQWTEMFNWSFIDHWNHHPITLEQHAHWVSSPTYRPAGDLIALAADGTFAAFCRCQIDDEDNTNRERNEGWIDSLGTRRGHRKIGLGRAMLLAGMHWLKTQGIATAVLGVDAENPSGALRLYESVGFVVQDTTSSYHKDL
jgi:mycothiol synthase